MYLEFGETKETIFDSVVLSALLPEGVTSHTLYSKVQFFSD